MVSFRVLESLDCTEAKDGAMDLLAIIPMERLKRKERFSVSEKTPERPRLETIIRDAQKRSEGTQKHGVAQKF